MGTARVGTWCAPVKVRASSFVMAVIALGLIHPKFLLLPNYNLIGIFVCPTPLNDPRSNLPDLRDAKGSVSAQRSLQRSKVSYCRLAGCARPAPVAATIAVLQPSERRLLMLLVRHSRRSAPVFPEQYLLASSRHTMRPPPPASVAVPDDMPGFAWAQLSGVWAKPMPADPRRRMKVKHIVLNFVGMFPCCCYAPQPWSR